MLAISLASRDPATASTLEECDAAMLAALVDSVTSEVGRALIGLMVLQLCVKAIVPEQSIRLHKAGGQGSNFSWAEGVPMRVLDKNYVTPALREHGLLKLNADGFMMTRSLAENYPYSPVYKAAIRGARAEWLALVDRIEARAVPPEPALRHLLGLLANRSDRFQKAAQAAVEAVRAYLPRILSLEDAIVGFVVDGEPNVKAEILGRIREIEQMHGVKVVIQGFAEWATSQASRTLGCPPATLARQWVLAFAESLCQMRREQAPIDEPADAWVAALGAHSASWK